MSNPSGRIQRTNDSQHTFARSPSANIPRSVFNRSHGVKTTFDEGYLIPVLVDEVVPGDTFHLKMHGFARVLSPMLTPIMDNIYLDTFFFFVPNRLVWDNWEKFCGAQANPADSTSYVLPTCTDQPTALTLQDYAGLPPQASNNLTWNNLPFRAMNLIYNEWFRDENLQDSLVVDVDDGPDTMSDYTLFRRNKRYDYFTSCLPWPQKVNDGTTLNIPLSGTAPVSGLGFGTSASVATGPVTVKETDGTSPSYAKYINASSAAYLQLEDAPSATGYPNIYADLTAASGITVNELRETIQIQKLFERDARGGTRYTEIVRNHFGVLSPDARLQRPEYLGGGSSYVHVHPVANTSGTATEDQGQLTAFGTASVEGHGFSKSFVEHGYVIGFVSTRADLNYQQGIERMWSRSTRYDLYWPTFAHLGEQSVLNKEIYADGTANDDLVFGYQERYGEMRYKPSNITAAFRSSYATTLDTWHVAQDFSSLPSLDTSFIIEEAPLDRVLADGTIPHFVLDSHFEYRCVRPMPVYGVPGLVDHF